MRISVIIPAYNEQGHLPDCLASLQKQIVPADEIIVVDNNSTDQTFKIAKQFKVRVLKEKKQGTVYARNRGFNHAGYEIIARTDADAILPPNWLKKIKLAFQNKKIDALAGPTEFYDSPFGKLFSKKMYMAFLKSVQKHHTLLGPNMALTKKIWNKVKNEVCLLPNHKLSEDIDLAIHINHRGGIIGYDRTNKVDVSIRRAKKDPYSFYIKYPLLFTSSVLYHKNRQIY